MALEDAQSGKRMLPRTRSLCGEPSHPDAILDQLMHNAYRIKLKGVSMRKLNATGNSKPSSTNVT